MQIIGRSVGAALAMGNACVLKPAEEACPALCIGRIAATMRLPARVNIVPGLGEEAGAALTAHAGVQHLLVHRLPVDRAWCGGSCEAHRARDARARRQEPADRLRRCRPGRGAAALVNAGIQNAGQTCSPARASWSNAQPLRRGGGAPRACARAEGGPALADLDLGPLISKRQHEIVSHYLGLARDAGLSITAQGEIVDSAPAGGFYDAADAGGGRARGARAGAGGDLRPGAGGDRLRRRADALRIANGTPYGPVAGVWTRDGSRALRMARALRCGQVFINNYSASGGVEMPASAASAPRATGRERASRRCTASRR